MEQIEKAESKNWYDKWHKPLLFVPVAVLLISLVYLVIFNNQTGLQLLFLEI